MSVACVLRMGKKMSTICQVSYDDCGIGDTNWRNEGWVRIGERAAVGRARSVVYRTAARSFIVNARLIIVLRVVHVVFPWCV